MSITCLYKYIPGYMALHDILSFSLMNACIEKIKFAWYWKPVAAMGGNTRYIGIGIDNQLSL